MNLDLKKPCKNCPFRKVGAIELHPERLAGIIEGLTEDDMSNFYCHKTVHGPRGGRFVDTDDEDGERYEDSGNESACMGAVNYMLKIGRPSVAVRWALVTRMIDLGEIQALNDEIIDPPEGAQL